MSRREEPRVMTVSFHWLLAWHTTLGHIIKDEAFALLPVMELAANAHRTSLGAGTRELSTERRAGAGVGAGLGKAGICACVCPNQMDASPRALSSSASCPILFDFCSCSVFVRPVSFFISSSHLWLRNNQRKVDAYAEVARCRVCSNSTLRP